MDDASAARRARVAAAWLLGAVIVLAGVSLLLDGRPAVASGHCQYTQYTPYAPYTPYGEPCPKATPTLNASPEPTAAQIGDVLDDRATLDNGLAPTGTITFALFGPDDAACSTALYTSTVTVNGNGDYLASAGSESGSRTTAAAGTYRWTVAYSGDDDNETAGSGCAEQPVTVAKSAPALVTAATPTTAEPGTTLNAFANVVGGYQASGRVAFRLYGPDDTNCVGTPAYTEETQVGGGSAYTSGGFVVPGEGTWRWTATYLGDTNNETTTSGCDQATVAVVKKITKPAKDPGGEPYTTNVYFNCVDDHNIGVPYGSRLVLRFGFGTLTEKQIQAFVRGTRTTATVDGFPVGHPETYWGKPELVTQLWVSRWNYDTGRVVTEGSPRFTVDFEIVATRTVTDGITTWNPGDTVVSIGGPCLVDGFAPTS